MSGNRNNFTMLLGRKVVLVNCYRQVKIKLSLPRHEDTGLHGKQNYFSAHS